MEMGKLSYILYSLLLALLAFSVAGCKKYLDAKSDQKLVVPSTIQDLQSILDDYARINKYHPSAGELSADDYFLDDQDWSNLNEYYKRMYIWEKQNLFQPGNNNDWVNCYNSVYKANVVLYHLDKIKREPNDELEWNNTKGMALFLRGISFAEVAWIWCLGYDRNTATTDLGIPLRLDPDFNKVSVRSTLQQTYDQSIQDLKEAIELLPVNPLHVLRPSKPAAEAWLARIYLSTREYDKALGYADRCLQRYNKLMDYNLLNTTIPIQSYNEEVIYHTSLTQPVYPPIAKVDSTIYSSYDKNDLRKTILFFNVGPNQFAFRGSYDGSDWDGSFFSGIATDEVYLMRAECYVRVGKVSEAMDDLNTLLISRWKEGTFKPFLANNGTDALQMILLERRKELHFRGLRWMDIKRLNKEGANIIIKRKLNGSIYSLSNNDLRYALPIPEDILAASGMPQNPR